MHITSDIKYVGVTDTNIDLFEGLYRVPDGISYNSYVIIDEQIAVMDTVDVGFTSQWLEQIQNLLGECKPHYLIVQHMEPDHSAGILSFIQKYPQAYIVASAKAFAMMVNYFGRDFADHQIVVTDGDELILGRHKLVFTTAPMVHWPEVIVTYDATDKILFSADAFGKFGLLDTKNWVDEARRYYIGIVGKYGVYVQKFLGKAAGWDIRTICPLHGPVLSENPEYYMGLYHTWSTYEPEEDGVLIAYTSIYGNTKKAALLLSEKLKEKGSPKVEVRDLARCDLSEAVAEAFRYSKLVLATTTYNTQIFPPMREFIMWLTERNFSNRTVAFVENGSWMPIVARLMKDAFERSKGITFAGNTVQILSALNEESTAQIEALAEELCE